MNALIYDIEIENAILKKGEQPEEGIEYCNGWTDFDGMGIACIGAYDYRQDRYRVFMDDNLSEFVDLCDRSDVIIDYNGTKFDRRILLANGIDFASGKHYDMLREIWLAAGLNPDVYNYDGHRFYSLDSMCEVNSAGRLHKSGNGALAPINYQRGNIGSLIDYCLNDIRMTKFLFDQITANDGILTNPKNINTTLQVAQPKV